MLMMLLLLSSFTWQTNDKYSLHLWWWEAYCVTFERGGFRCCNCLLPS